MKMNAGTGAGAGAGANARKRKRTHARARSFIHSFMCPRDDEENPKRPNCYAKRKRAHERTSARTMKMNADTTQTQTSARTCTLIHSFKRKRAHERTNDENERGHMFSSVAQAQAQAQTQTQTNARTCTLIHSFIHVPARWRGESKKAKLLRKTQTSARTHER